MQIRVRATGEGLHRFRLRTENLDIADVEQERVLNKTTATVVEWQGSIHSLKDKPWTAVIIADDNPCNRKELMGTPCDAQ